MSATARLPVRPLGPAGEPVTRKTPLRAPATAGRVLQPTRTPRQLPLFGPSKF
jgi:hypothetical protein